MERGFNLAIHHYSDLVTGKISIFQCNDLTKKSASGDVSITKSTFLS